MGPNKDIRYLLLNGNLETEYLIASKLGIITIKIKENGDPLFSITLEGGQTIKIDSESVMCTQQLLPFPKILRARDLLEYFKQNQKRIFNAVSLVSVRRDCLFSLCISGGDSALELLETNPALALLVANKIDQISGFDDEKNVSKILNMKRQKILNFCSYPDEKWVVHLLGKISPSQCGLVLLADLKAILLQGDSRKRKVLRHISKLNSLVVNVLNDPSSSALVNYNFYESACTYPDTDSDIEVRYLLSEVKRLSNVCQQLNPPKANNVKDLSRMHGLCINWYNSRQMLNHIKRLKFPDPPIKSDGKAKEGNQYEIFPLISGEELLFEGKKMRHCIASYADIIANGEKYYVYHVYTPSDGEATFLIEKLGPRWMLREIRGYSNKEVSEKTLNLVKKWLSESQDI